MKEAAFIVQNRLREATVSLERANLLKCDENWKSDGSVPPFSSIGLILQGRGTICADDIEMHPYAGQLYLLPAKTKQVFFTDSQDPYQKYFCHFEITCQQSDLFDLIHLPLCVDAKNPEYAKEIFEKMISVCRGRDIYSSLWAKQLVLELLCYYMRCCPQDHITFVSRNFDSPLAAAVSYVETHLHEPISVQQMADAAGYHSSHFTRVFQERMGISPGQFVIRQKTERAAELLTTTTMSVAAIADDLGFGSPFHFSGFFKKQTGMSPSLYRSLYLREHL